MNIADLKPGHLYRLTQDVENPLCDKRSSDKFKKLPVFAKGMLIVCLAPNDAPRLRTLHSTDIGLSGHNSCRGFTAAAYREKGVGPSKHPRDQKWTEAIVPHLEEIAIDTWTLMQRAYGWHAESAVLKELVKDGTVPLERVITMMRKHTLGASVE